MSLSNELKIIRWITLNLNTIRYRLLLKKFSLNINVFSHESKHRTQWFIIYHYPLLFNLAIFENQFIFEDDHMHFKASSETVKIRRSIKYWNLDFKKYIYSFQTSVVVICCCLFISRPKTSLWYSYPTYWRQCIHIIILL